MFDIGTIWYVAHRRTPSRGQAGHKRAYRDPEALREMEGHRLDVRPDGLAPHQGFPRRGLVRGVEELPIIPIGRSVACDLSRRSGRDVVSSRVNHRPRLSEAMMKDYRAAKKRATVTVGESVRILRELQEMSQNELSEVSGIPQATISAIENDRVRLGVERAKVLARALKCHPGVLVFPGWTGEEAA